MIAFCGYAFYEPPESAERMLSGMLTGLSLDPRRFHSMNLVRPQFGLAMAVRKEEAFGFATDERADVVLVAKGEFAPSSLGLCYVKEGNEAMAEVLLHRYLKDGITSLMGLNGRYAVVIWNGREKRLFMVNDPLGMQRLCWTWAGQALLFGTQYKPFLNWSKVSSKLDDLAVAEVFALGYPIEERTLLRDIKLAPPGSIGTATPSGLRWSRYSELLETPAWEGISLDQSADRLGETLDEVVGEYGSVLKGPLVVPISGGMDSRTILGFAQRAGIRDIHTYSYGHRHTYDVRLGGRIARTAGVPHHYLYLSNSYIRDFIEEDIAVTEGEASAHSFHNSILKQVLTSDSVLWSGFIGDALSGYGLCEYGHFPHLSSKLERINVMFANKYMRCSS
jgi:hypothetical protein